MNLHKSGSWPLVHSTVLPNTLACNLQGNGGFFRPPWWSHDEWVKKQAIYTWLGLSKNDRIICTTCNGAKNLHGDGKGIYIRDEWTSRGVTATGNDRKAQLTDIRSKIAKHLRSQSHKKAIAVMDTASKRTLETAVDNLNKSAQSVTSRIFRSAYFLAKHDLPYSLHPGCCELLEKCDVELSIGLRSRASATEIIDLIGRTMRTNLCKAIQSRDRKISIMIDESTTVANKSPMVVYLRCQPLEADQSPFAFPLALCELDALDALHITTQLLACLAEHGFTHEYLKLNLIGVCTDGASTMVGSNSGVIKKLADNYPNIIPWHCMCHRVELAVGDAAKAVTRVNHVKIFLDKVYSLYSQSPKAQR